ncbi:peptidoglycan editing factor PgeF [Cytobacillus horneckiae]|uniref:Purine nucleoside phosphorylase n=2 Tax=Cytobacillus horneckiae TaxID=549687 RepID=A0A2N0ZBF9_9BACI|nr:peptidoglycan editing factor PgeF [Cytobacillus horneckiae]MEC1156929.1 peptidoglycan editing factor PgeF [Cytobacillus horneckiae]MED2940045.1 peptidoglycan editing factor PgeF [Cytobacillus horneckiae]PKG26861.1 peptidoglycan editing factor PgeF [Cytobacillus horneckiae]
MEPFKLQQREFVMIDDWNQTYGIIAGMTTKQGGFSQGAFSSLNMGLHVKDSEGDVLKNRRELGEIIHFPIEQWVGAEQTHQTHIENISEHQSGRGSMSYEDSFKGTDGFFTSSKGILLTMCYADCIPIYFLHPSSNAIGIVHAGWKGTVNGIAEEMVKRFKAKGIKASEIKVAIGPGICQDCYIVNDFVIDQAKRFIGGEYSKPYQQISEGQYSLDLKLLNKQILIRAGIIESSLQVTNYCTSCHHDLFFSHRRDKGHTGRMMSFIGWKEER